MRPERGTMVLEVLFTVTLVSLIGGLALLAAVFNNRPCGTALERLDRNEATDRDMKTLQQCRDNTLTTARIINAGGSVISSSGPPTNPTVKGLWQDGVKTLMDGVTEQLTAPQSLRPVEPGKPTDRAALARAVTDADKRPLLDELERTRIAQRWTADDHVRVLYGIWNARNVGYLLVAANQMRAYAGCHADFLGAVEALDADRAAGRLGRTPGEYIGARSRLHEKLRQCIGDADRAAFEARKSL